ncbi:potassium channel family protein [Romboutsia lituseburensis]|uniref:Trk system potassium uptake protein TrkA n=1 Tax=Romboutsia lituseburensis DSM 797 TaxID=1121325 RepID=A0A1G9PGT3_9FIRM|nr:NAD-binding protein [Romboutsia lituseburensis]CEH33359.1 K+ uptake protein, NAD-binding subunit TrkA1 [Romboutsia lituseburensis]SDL97355.1 trk system potassium uptake protein TrkA [Romboutsia lituseburensis DSM 797]
MKVIVIGGGKVGFYLINTLKNKKHDVTLIEKDKNLCEKISEQVDIDIINGDGTDIDVLKDADIDVADVVAAVTGKDEENLVICQVVKNNFNIQHTIARVNNPKNQQLFKTLGVDSTVCSTQVITNLIDWECESEKIRILQIFERGETILAEVDIDKKASWCDKLVKNLDIPANCVLVSVFRDGEVIYPKGDTMIKEHDKIVLVTDSNNMTNEDGKNYSKLEKALFRH